MDFGAELGPDALLWAERTGMAVTSGLDDWRLYDCGGAYPGCTGRRVHQLDGWFASCPNTPAACEPISFTDPRQVVVDESSLVPLLQRALGVVQQASATKLGVARLGSRRFGDRTVDFVFVADPGDELVESWFARATANPRQPIAAITFDRAQAPAELPAQDQVEWLFLSDGLPTPDGLILDLAGVLERFAPHALDGSLLWPRYRFVVDESRSLIWFAGALLKLPTPEVLRLLLALLRHPHERMSLSSLLPSVYGRRKRVSEAMLRKVKSALVDVLEDAVEGRPDIALPLGRDSDGPGYGLSLPFGSVRWLQTSPTSADPPADLEVP